MAEGDIGTCRCATMAWYCFLSSSGVRKLQCSELQFKLSRFGSDIVSWNSGPESWYMKSENIPDGGCFNISNKMASNPATKLCAALTTSRQPCNWLYQQQLFTSSTNGFLRFATHQKTVQYVSSSYHITQTIVMPALACLKKKVRCMTLFYSEGTYKFYQTEGRVANFGPGGRVKNI